MHDVRRDFGQVLGVVDDVILRQKQVVGEVMRLDLREANRKGIIAIVALGFFNIGDQVADGHLVNRTTRRRPSSAACSWASFAGFMSKISL